MKNFEINKKSMASILLAMGISLCSNNAYNEMIYDREVKQIKVNGNKVNIRLTPTTDTKKNIIGSVNTGDTFTVINHQDGWYLIDYYGEYAYINDKYGKEVSNQYFANYTNKINVAKITGNNINVRSSDSTKSAVIGFADVTDSFKIINKIND